MSTKIIPEQNQLLTRQQLQLLSQLRQFEPVLQFHSLTELPLSNSLQLGDKENNSLGHQNKINVKLNKIQSAEITTTFHNVNLGKKQSSNMFIQKQQKLQNPQFTKQHSVSEPLFLLNKQLQTSGPVEYYQLKQKLLKYKQKSDQIYKVGQFIKSYEQNFTQLIKQKQQLVTMLHGIKGETTNLVEKQKKLIDFSMCLKQSLDYFTYHEKHSFNFPCEVSCRQSFQDSLQPTLSSLMDGIQFFSDNQKYVSSKKHLSQFLNSKSKILSFIKSFYIKLFNKENNFIMKYVQLNKIHSQLNSFYPKSRIHLLTQMLLTFPQFKRQLKQTLTGVKDNSQGDQKKQQEVTFMQLREHQISQFLLSQTNISLMRYLEKNNFEIYSQVMLNLWTFNRYNFHQNLVFIWSRSINNQVLKKPNEKDESKINQQHINTLKTRIIFVLQIIIAEYMYFFLCCHPSTSPSIQFITSWLYKLIYKYLQVLVKQAREFVIKYKYDPFQLCEKIQRIIDVQLKGYFQNIKKQQYGSYVIGFLWLDLTTKIMTENVNNTKNKDNIHVKVLKDIFDNTIKGKLLAELGQYCFQHLPKINPTQNINQIEENINKLLHFVPQLKYCLKHAQNYMISSFDTLIKSIKSVNTSIQSRYECYVWNLVAFGCIRNVLKSKKFQMVSKQIRFDFNESLGIIDRVKRLQRSQSLIKYAQDIFNVIKTGMPSLNQLTLDFNKYINEHYEELQERFLKDILFIYAKNMIEFLLRIMLVKKRIESEKQISVQKNYKQAIEQKATQITEAQILTRHQQPSSQQIKKLCDPISMRSLYNSYVLSIQKYIKQSCQILKIVEQSSIKGKQAQIINLKNLIKQVYQKLFDFLDTFYITLSQLNSDLTAEFDQIAHIKQKQEKLWLSTKQLTTAQKIQPLKNQSPKI